MSEKKKNSKPLVWSKKDADFGVGLRESHAKGSFWYRSGNHREDSSLHKALHCSHRGLLSLSLSLFFSDTEQWRDLPLRADNHYLSSPIHSHKQPFLSVYTITTTRSISPTTILLDQEGLSAQQVVLSESEKARSFRSPLSKKTFRFRSSEQGNWFRTELASVDISFSALLPPPLLSAIWTRWCFLGFIFN